MGAVLGSAGRTLWQAPDLEQLIAKRNELISARDYDAARGVAAQIVAEVAKTKPNSQLHGESLYFLGYIERRLGHGDASARALLQSVALLDPIDGAELSASDVHRELGYLLRDAGRVGEGVDQLKRSIVKGLVAAPAGDRTLAAVAFEAGRLLYEELSRYEEALPLLEQSVALFDRYGKETPERGAAASYYAGLCNDALHRYPEAERALAAAIAGFAGDLRMLMPKLSLGTLQHRLGDFDKARATYEEVAKAAAERRAEAPEFCGVKELEATINLGLLDQDVGRFVEAEATMVRTLARFEQGDLDLPLQKAALLSNLGGLYNQLGRSDEADHRYREALGVYDSIEDANPGVARLVATTRNNLGLVALARGPEAAREAAVLFEAALKTYRAEASPDLALVASTQGNHARAVLMVGDAQLAETEFRAALETGRKAIPPGHPDLGWLANGLADALDAQGRNEEARSVHEEALRTLEGAFGTDNPAWSSAASDAVLNLVALDRRQDAVALLQKAVAARAAHLRRTARGVADRSAVAYAATFGRDVDLVPTLSNAGWLEPADAYDQLLKIRGLATSTAMEASARRRLLASDPELAALTQRLGKAQKRVQLLSTAPPAGLDRRAVAEALRRATLDAEALEREANQRAAQQDGRLDGIAPSESAVAAALGQGDALVEFVRYVPVRPANVPAQYGAFVVSLGDIRWIRLGDATSLEADVAGLVASIRNGSPDEASRSQALFARLIEPLKVNATRVRIVADGVLAALPIEALEDSAGTPLLETWEVSYLGSGRELLAPSRPAGPMQPPTILAGPEFGIDPVRADGGWAPLPGAASEGDAIAALLSPSGPQLLKGPSATEEAVEAVRRPEYLHLATHGFFYLQPPAGASSRLAPGAPLRRRLEASEDPLLRSGLVLAGANEADARVQAGKSDGYLTALEVAGLDLVGTRLVVLSGCDTGQGDYRVGEGVFGLQRAFRFAGAETLVMSLFPVPDKPSKQLMERMYAGLAEGQSPAAALRAAKLALRQRVDTRAPQNWAGFVAFGGR